MTEEPNFPNNVLFQRIGQIYEPAQNWTKCEQPMTTAELIHTINQQLPGYFENAERLLDIMEQLHFRYERNEHNNKMYWLINPA